MLKIRPYNYTYNDKLNATFKRLFPKEDDFDFPNDLSLLVLGRNDDVKGFIIITDLGDDDVDKDDSLTFHISFLGLVPRYQRRGIASTLINETKKKVNKLTLYAHQYNFEAIKLYKKLGFKKKGRTGKDRYQHYIWRRDPGPPSTPS